MRALQVDRSVTRFATARLSSRPAVLRLTETEPPAPPGPDWVTIRPLLSGICGSDLATVYGRASRWFEPYVSFPFTPGHEIVAETATGERVVVEPVLHCTIRGVDPVCSSCAAGRTNRCENLAAGHIAAGLQTGYCNQTGGGWSGALVAHRKQLHYVPAGWSDEAAVLVEPVACSVHAALSAPPGEPRVAAVVGAGTIGLATIAAIRSFREDVTTVIAVAKHPDQRRLARQLGADVVAEPDELRRAVRRATGSWVLDSGQLTGGAGVVFDCVGTSESLSSSTAVAAPGATVVLAGMPGRVNIDLTALWQRELRLAGAYAYGPEPGAGDRHSFDLAMQLISEHDMGRLVSALYPLERHSEALDHASHAGARGATKVAFDLRHEKRR